MIFLDPKNIVDYVNIHGKSLGKSYVIFTAKQFNDQTKEI